LKNNDQHSGSGRSPTDGRERNRSLRLVAAGGVCSLDGEGRTRQFYPGVTNLLGKFVYRRRGDVHQREASESDSLGDHQLHVFHGGSQNQDDRAMRTIEGTDYRKEITGQWRRVLPAGGIRDVKEKMKRLLTVAGVAAAVIWIGAGCKSFSGDLEIDTPFFDISYEGKAAE
tara:strand:- start:712 stop:1224 length:513 start_codon:yes stop_codon:yes gene_type:complete